MWDRGQRLSYDKDGSLTWPYQSQGLAAPEFWQLLFSAWSIVFYYFSLISLFLAILPRISEASHLCSCLYTSRLTALLSDEYWNLDLKWILCEQYCHLSDTGVTATGGDVLGRGEILKLVDTQTKGQLHFAFKECWISGWILFLSSLHFFSRRARDYRQNWAFPSCCLEQWHKGNDPGVQRKARCNISSPQSGMCLKINK